MDRKGLRRICVWAVVFGALWVLCARLLLQNLYRFLEFDPTFYGIFQQLRGAEIRPPMVLLTLGALSLAWILGRLKERKFLRIFIVAPLWLAAALAVLLLTRVNGIRFGDVLFSLLDVLGKGGL
ncbi:MAG: hypothetical protein E7436_02385 [Ruminococcaceae bacterium]|nr:hypothetical protein [Oscillospiraceae bacterium]